MAGTTENLIPCQHKFTREDQRKGGLASAEKKRRAKDLRAAAEALLEKKYEMKEAGGKKLSGSDAIMLKIMCQALAGDLKAAEFIRDITGQKPTEKMEQTQMVIDLSAYSTEEIKALLDKEV